MIVDIPLCIGLLLKKYEKNWMLLDLISLSERHRERERERARDKGEMYISNMLSPNSFDE